MTNPTPEQNSGAAPQSSALREDSVNESLSIGAAPLPSKQRFPETYQEKFRAWAKGRPLIQANHAITLEQAADHLDEITASLLAKNAEIERLTRELEVQKVVNELAYIPHRSLVESRDSLQKRYDKVEAERDEWARKWHRVRAELAELKYPGMKGIVRPLSGEPGSGHETTGNSRNAYISDLTVRRLDSGYVVTWREDGEPCGSETISEKLAYALVRADGGASGMTDDRPSSKAGENHGSG